MLKVDPEVFKLKDPRVTALSSGRLPVRQLAHTITPGDWLIMGAGTIYALTEAEYYASQEITSIPTLSKEAFEEVLTWSPDLFAPADVKVLQNIRKQKNKCTKCKYNAYRAKVLSILQKYPSLLDKIKDPEKERPVTPYPETQGEVKSKVPEVFPRFFGQSTYERKPCLDCVEKHLSVAHTWLLLGQASIKGCEAKQGYPEHRGLALANMQEAYEECPHDFPELRELIMFCIGKSKKDKEIFLPLEALLYVVQLARAETTSEDALQENQINEDFSLELSGDMREALYKLPLHIKAKIMGVLEKLLEVEYSTAPQQKTLFQGYLASLADMLVEFSPEVSNLLRNRRLMFKAAPSLVQNTEYDCKDIKEALLQPTKVQEKVSSDSGSTDNA